MKFKRRPEVVNAIRWNPNQYGSQVGDWTSPFKMAKKWVVGAVCLNLYVETATNSRHIASPGDWIVKQENGKFDVFTNIEFKRQFKSCKK